MIRQINTWLAVLVCLLLSAGGVQAQQTVYKWVDTDGVVHFGETPPAGVEAERITTDRAPPTSASPAPPAPARGAAAPQAEAADAPQVVEAAPAVAAPSIEAMSQAELDSRCEAAREAKIAPLREAEIARCKSEPRTDPRFCEDFNADFGEGGRTVDGAIRPRMFDDLPECVEALQERNRRTTR